MHDTCEYLLLFTVTVFIYFFRSTAFSVTEKDNNKDQVCPSYPVQTRRRALERNPTLHSWCLDFVMMQVRERWKQEAGLGEVPFLHLFFLHLLVLHHCHIQKCWHSMGGFAICYLWLDQNQQVFSLQKQIVLDFSACFADKRIKTIWKEVNRS